MRKVKFFIVSALSIWAFLSTYILIQRPIENRIRELVPGKISFFSYPVYEEKINNPLDGYNAQAYMFSFKDFDKVDGCKLLSSNTFLEKPFFDSGHILYGAAIFIPLNEIICVKSVMNNGSQELLITHKKGLIYFSYF